MTEHQRLASAVFRFSPAVRRIVTRFALVACPPQVRQAGRTEELLGELEATLGALFSAVRRLVPLVFVAFDQGARLHPQARGRRFPRLDDRAAEGYLRAVSASRRHSLAAIFQRIKGLVVTSYYELPEVKAELGYHPEPYIATVSRRRSHPTEHSSATARPTSWRAFAATRTPPRPARKAMAENCRA